MYHLNKKELQCNVEFIIQAEVTYTKTIAEKLRKEKWNGTAVNPSYVSKLVKYHLKVDCYLRYVEHLECSVG